MNQPKPGTKAYSTLVDIVDYGEHYKPLIFTKVGNDWDMFSKGIYLRTYSAQVFRHIGRFITGARTYANGTLTGISDARVVVQFVPAEKEAK